MKKIKNIYSLCRNNILKYNLLNRYKWKLICKEHLNDFKCDISEYFNDNFKTSFFHLNKEIPNENHLR
jgi:hypothetical protein